MNDIIRSLHARKSVRVFTGEAVSTEIKKVLVEAAIQAPSAGNQIMYSIIDVTDEALKARLAVTCDNQAFIATAPLVYIFVAEQNRWIRSFELAGAEPRSQSVGDLMLSVTDTVIAAQNMVVAAESLGLGSCYIGDILENCEEHRALLGLPQHAVPVCMLVLGYPTDKQGERKKPTRISSEYVVGTNTYRKLSDEELRACYYDQKERSGDVNVQEFDEFMKAFCARKYNSEFSIEMARSVGEYLKAYEK